MLYDDRHFSDMPQHQRLLPPWCWWLVVSLSYGDIATTLLGQRIGIIDRNPLYAHTTFTVLPWLLLVTHAALLLLLALIAHLHRRVGIVGALAMSLLIYLPAIVINTALILAKLPPR